ncbi:MAG: hypothetical protein CMJ46_09480 [Planctomyces sp.]|nr:hypothetical protein [Planctomyces sp.]
MNRSFNMLLLALTPLMTIAGCSKAPTSETADQPTYKPRVVQTEVDVATAVRQPLQLELEFTGDLLPKRATRVVSELDGVVKSVPKVGAKFDVIANGKTYSEQLSITYGQEVKENEILVQLDTRDDEVALQIAEAKLEKAKADLAQLKAWERAEEVDRLVSLKNEAQARLDLAEKKLDRVRQLQERNAASVSDVDQAEMDVATSKAALEGATAVVARAKAGPTADEIAVMQAQVSQAEAEVKQHEREIEKATIRAPYDAVITSFNVEVGDHVAPGGTPIAEMMDVRYLVAEISIPEAYVGQVEVHDLAQVRTAGNRTPVTGLVVAVNDLVDPQSRSFTARVAIDNADRKFKAGQFATVVLSFGEEGDKRLAVPTKSIVFKEGEPHVYVVDQARAEAVRVRTGIRNDSLTEIVDGLEEGTPVVTDDPNLLADGMKVTIRQAKDPQQVAARP